MTNTLVKIGRQASVWVPPVYREIAVPRTVQAQSATWESAPFRTEYRYSLPDGWVVTPTLDMNGVGFALRPNQRVVGNVLEVWTIPFGGRSTVQLYRQATAPKTHTYLTYTSELVAPGYWMARADEPSWAHGAQSHDKKRAPWAMQFKVPHAEHGVLVGPALASSEPSGDDLRQRIAQGFLVQGDTALVWSTQSPPASAPMQWLNPIPAVTPDTVLRMEGDGKRITWLVDGVPVARAGMVLAGDPQLVMAAALSGPMDSVDSPVFTGKVGGQMLLQATPVVVLTSSVPAISRQGRAFLVATPTLQAHGYGNHLVDTRQPCLQASSRGAWANLQDRRTPRLMAVGLVGAVGRSVLQASPYMAAHGYTQGFANLKVLPWVRITAAKVVPNTEETLVAFDAIYSERDAGMGAVAVDNAVVLADISATIRRNVASSTRLRAKDHTDTSRLLYSVLTEHLQVAVPMQGRRLLDGRVLEVVQGASRVHIGVLLDAQVQEALQGVAGMNAGRITDAALLEQLAAQLGVEHAAVLQALVSELLGVTVLQDLGQPTEVWSVTESGESTSYTDYPFDSFANIGGHFFGASETGLYELEGDSDDGQPIEAAINLGERDLDTNAIKSLANAYVSVNSSAPMRLQVKLGGQQYTYLTRGAGPSMQTQRFDLGRGLRGHFFELQLMNTDGADFELGGLEFVAQESKRRI